MLVSVLVVVRWLISLPPDLRIGVDITPNRSMMEPSFSSRKGLDKDLRAGAGGVAGPLGKTETGRRI
jgi:hypothetical protein